ncbi:hypothetical protein OH764_34875 (plasmid) [Burkholderia sp. M6-3]
MDIREIQRLHAQFAPDSMVIDLPRQIAALPGPGDVSEADPSRAMHARLAGVGPRARQAAIALAVAAMVAMAGIGAASLYTNMSAHRPAAAATPAVASTRGDAVIPGAGNPEVPAYREVDATPARPVNAAPTLSASDFASARSLGLTADQFRDSLKAPARAAQAAAPATAPALTSEVQRAAASPIHRAGPSREAVASTPQSALPVQVAPAQPPVASKPAAMAQPAQASATTTRASAPADQTATATQPAQQAPTAAAATQQPAKAVRPAHATHHHNSRPGTESAESNPDVRPPADSRTGSAEVKMF